jgi:hypothetical protein
MMTGMNDQTKPKVETGAEFHLVDLVPGDCCHTERVYLETKLQRLEQSLNGWLLEKLSARESERLAPSVAGTGTHLLQRHPDVTVARIEGHVSGQEEVILMNTDERDILEVLQAELDFIEAGGYGRSPRTPGKAKSPFQDSLTCINYTYPEKVHPCSECHLIDFVPNDRRSEEIPCHFIPLNESGETLEQLDAEDDQRKLEEALKSWLRAKIKEIEAAREVSQQPT